MKLSNLLNKSLAAVWLIVLAAGFSLAQTKSLADAEAEIKLFDDPAAFTLFYDEARYVTVAGMNVGIIAENDDLLRKKLSRFDWELSSLFALRGIDAKPVQTMLCITSQSKTFLFSRENELTIFFPDEDVRFGTPNRLSEIRKGKAGEKLCWEISQEIIGDLARTDEIDFQVGPIRTKVRSDKLPVFRDYAKLLEIR